MLIGHNHAVHGPGPDDAANILRKYPAGFPKSAKLLGGVTSKIRKAKQWMNCGTLLVFVSERIALALSVRREHKALTYTMTPYCGGVRCFRGRAAGRSGLALFWGAVCC